jgi:hypothetical protein
MSPLASLLPFALLLSTSPIDPSSLPTPAARTELALAHPSRALPMPLPTEITVVAPALPAAVVAPADLKPADLKPGDTFDFEGLCLVKLEREEVPDPVEDARVLTDWHREIRNFIRSEAGDDRRLFVDLLSAQGRNFVPFDVKITELLARIHREVGPDFSIVLEGDLKRIYDDSNERYEKDLRNLLGDVGIERFLELRRSYARVALDQIKRLPDGFR